MAYSDLLAKQQRDLELLHQSHYADEATLRQLQKDHYDKTRYDGQLERLQADFQNKAKEMESRFQQEQRSYLNEPEPPAPKPDISQSQDKAVVMMQEYRQQQADREKKNQEAPQSDKPTQSPSPSASNPKDEDIKRMMEDTKKRRQTWQYKRGGHKR
jgi:hypothetical protein